MRGAIGRSRALALALLAAAGAAPAAVYEATVVGVTDDTNVIEGDACGTGASGAGACDGETIVVEWQVFAEAAPADQDALADEGHYVAGEELFFLAADVTVAGQSFSMLSTPTQSRSQSVEVWDDLNTAGITDRILLALTVSGDSGESFVSSNLLLGPVFDGDELDAVAGPYAGPPVLPGTSTFLLQNETGIVVGQYSVTDVTLATDAPEPRRAMQLAAAIGALALLAARGSARAATRR